ncbi:[FeFe] hydrogenase H-cluster maturation GTPase HydF [Oribacterium sinus]|uniref:[FeFe] hydrogenase H-cluster maturation GTPase HydF n=1 Tax=Oribacterium sinus TaxID=237576 RepID=A0A930DJY1_9FIRM|nr:[FeFe] hydrogenase H-cluster maturation GTPase HydF [Oribacterium sinus]MBF1272150.1 [FeFe] hydrogenase H-cluster maturation GTPase HydF [Oribacterium sinus]
MSLQDTPQGERIHIAFFGRRNAGKSSFFNAIAGQKLSLTSETLGTTTDPVRKSMEILPLGPVLLIDTPGFDDEGELGSMRVERTKEVLRETDIALLFLPAKDFLSAKDVLPARKEEQGEGFFLSDIEGQEEGLFLPEKEASYLRLFQENKIPPFLLLSQSDKLSSEGRRQIEDWISRKKDLPFQGIFLVSSETKEGVEAVKNAFAPLASLQEEKKRLFHGLVEPGDFVVLVTPIDESAPKGRLILPQQMAIRDILDYNGIPLVCQVEELPKILENLGDKIKLVVTDSQAFSKVNQILPKTMPLTSFSILMARYKGFLSYALEGCAVLSTLEDGDRVYIAEGCSHHRQCGDIGTVKLPRMLEKYTGKKLQFVYSEGKGFLPEEEQKRVKIMIHCGACMLSEKEVESRYQDFLRKKIPICNYGLAMAKMTGILERSIEML